MQSNRRRHVNGAAFDGSIVPQSASLPADAGEDASEESDIDWEDADENDHDNNTVHDGDNIATRLPSLPSEGVTITFSSASNTPSEEKGLAGNHEYQALNKEETTSKKRKRSTVRVLINIPYHTEQVILNERRSHLLCCLSHSLRCSSLCSIGQSQNHQSSQTIDNDKEEASLLLNTACSLVPAELQKKQIHRQQTASSRPMNSCITFQNGSFNLPILENVAKLPCNGISPRVLREKYGRLLGNGDVHLLQLIAIHPKVRRGETCLVATNMNVKHILLNCYQTTYFLQTV